MQTIQRFIYWSLFFCCASSYADQGRIVAGSFANAAGSRGYELYIPAGAGTQMPLVMVLHGCFMTPDDMIAGTNLNALADQRHFLVLYPQQTFEDNTSACWNWFLPENLSRDSGEASILVGMVQKVIADKKADATRVFVSGLSAGGAMASNLMACYSDVFAAGMVESGLAYDAAENLSEGLSVEQSGSPRPARLTAERAFHCAPPQSKPVKLIEFHGTADPYVAAINATQIEQQFDQLNRLLLPNASAVQTKLDIPQSNDTYAATEIDDSYDGVVSVRHIEVQGMGHGWSGGSSGAPYMEPKGVDASTMMMDFFLN